MTSPERLQELAAAVDPRAGLTSLFFLSPGEGVTELLLIRHAQIEPTTTGDDLHLTALGREQAEVLARYLSRGSIHAVYASPTARARETAEPIARATGLTVSTVNDLRDVDHARPMDRPLLDLLIEEHGLEGAEQALESMRADMTFNALEPFFEPGAAFRARVVAALDAIIEAHPGERVAIVTHAPVIMIYVAEVLGSPRDFAMNPSLTSITSVFARDGRRTLDYVNARPHFEGLTAP